MIQAHILYSGTVQGVGFRYTAQRVALGLDLKGWVKNLGNGSVEICVEGSKDKIKQFCLNVEDTFQGNISNKEIQFAPAREKVNAFEIAY